MFSCKRDRKRPAVHLRVVELEGDGQHRFQELPAVASPDEKGIVEDAAVHAHRAVNIRVHDGARADDHALGQVVVGAGFGHLARKAQIVRLKARKVAVKRHVAGADLAGAVLHDGVHGQRVVAHQLAPHREQVEFFHLAGGLPDAPAQQQVEFQSTPVAEPNYRRHIQRFEKGHHRVRRVHPEVKRRRTGRRPRVNGGRLHSARSRAAISPD